MLRGGARLGPGVTNLFRKTPRSSIPGGGGATISLGYGKNGQIIGMAPNGTPVAQTKAPFNPVKPSSATGQVVSGSKSSAGIFAKGALNIGGRLASGVAPGLLNGLFTGIEEFGGNNNHSFGRKVARTAGSTVGGIIGGALGSFAGPIGIMIGSYAGSQLGKLIGGNDYRRNKKKQE